MGSLRFHALDVVRRLPHPGRGFTQGLIVRGDTVWESIGGYATSALLRYRVGAEQPSMRAPLPPEMFAEGICEAGGQIWQLTWQERVAFAWDPESLELIGTVPFNREGWGICRADDRLITSDGSSELVWRDPATLRPLGIIRVRLAGKRIGGLNDLDWAGGRVWANILASGYLLGIDPDSGEVTDIVDARAVRERHWGDPQAVMNGLARLTEPGQFLLTGKRWRSMYQVQLSEGRPRNVAAMLLTD